MKKERMPKITLTPVGHTAQRPAFNSCETWYTFVDHISIGACPPEWPEDHCVVFRADKINKEHLMLPEAHFYGPSAYGYLLYNDADIGDIFIQRVSDTRNSSKKQRKRTLLLCRKDGGELPELSETFHPGFKVGYCPVTMNVYNSVGYNDWVYLLPDPDRVDVANTPKDQWVYSLMQPVSAEDEPNSARLCVQEKMRKYTFPSGRKAAYVIKGYLLHRKVVQPPTKRDAGAHVALGPNMRDKAIRNIYGRRLAVTTTKNVLEGQDFVVSGVPLRILKRTTKGFTAYKLMGR